MFKERFIISVIAVFLGLSLTGAAFYIWQTTKIIPSPQFAQEQKSDNPSKEISEPQTNSLIIENPQDESVVDKRIIPISGTAQGAQTVIVSTDLQDLVISPASDGSFSTNVTLSQGVNPIHVAAIMGNGEVVEQVQTVTFTTEAF